MNSRGNIETNHETSSCFLYYRRHELGKDGQNRVVVGGWRVERHLEQPPEKVNSDRF